MNSQPVANNHLPKNRRCSGKLRILLERFYAVRPSQNSQPTPPWENSELDVRLGDRKSLVKGLAKELEIDEPYLEKRAAVVRKDLG
jgi:hypothetical protein